MPFISTSENYHHDSGCQIDDCARHYCNAHRLLWRDCDTANSDREGSGRPIFIMGDCPECEQDSRREKFVRQKEAA